jgi:pimeloyl-ACP methyl ester carboxylesterase
MHMRSTWMFGCWFSAAVLFGCEDEGDGHDHDHDQGTKPEAAMMGGAAQAAGAGAAETAMLKGTGTYADPEHWLCRPGRQDACAVNLDSTVVAADGTLTVEPYVAAQDPSIDCFYVYPTVSLDATPNSDLVAGPEERNVVAGQFARLGSQCRLFAPLYRQVTLTALRASLSGMATTPSDRNIGYQDALEAWNHYLEHDNQGRGVVLVGHSQGSFVLAQLVRETLDEMPADPRLIAAILMGSTVTVPKDAVVGGTFKQRELCTGDDQLGCIMVYASFRATVPPPANSLFARSMDPNQVAACTNPAALAGGKGELHAYLNAGGPSLGATAAPWVTPAPMITTPFVSVPGLLSAECIAADSGSYLAITVNSDPDDPRTDDITGDVMTNGMVAAEWGLHLIDAALTMGNLVDVVQAKASAYAERSSASPSPESGR